MAIRILNNRPLTKRLYTLDRLHQDPTVQSDARNGLGKAALAIEVGQHGGSRFERMSAFD